MPDPILELHRPDGTVVKNDNWADNPDAQTLPEQYKPADSRESVIATTLSPGLYTAILHERGEKKSGNALIEVYKFD